MFTLSVHQCDPDCNLMNEKYRPIQGMPVQLFDTCSINHRQALRNSTNVLTRDNASNFLEFLRIMEQIVFHNNELLRCNVDGTRCLEPLCPARLTVLLNYTRYYFPVPIEISQRGTGSVQSV